MNQPSSSPEPTGVAIAPATAPVGSFWVTENQLAQLHFFVTRRMYVSITGWIAKVQTQKI